MVLVPAAAVGAVGTPVNAGLLVTKAVVASCVVLVPAAAVGAVGMPVNAGLILADSILAWVASAVHALSLLYADKILVVELYQSCPKIG